MKVLEGQSTVFEATPAKSSAASAPPAQLESATAELLISSERLRDSQAITRNTLDALKASLDREKLTLAFAEIGTCEFDVRSRMVRASEMSLRLFGIRSDHPDIPYT